jgi:hypothetical protein
MSEESVMSSSVRDITESTEAEGRDDTHHTYGDEPLAPAETSSKLGGFRITSNSLKITTRV